MTAPAPSPAEQQQIDRFDIFAEERVVEEVARAIFDTWYPDPNSSARMFITGEDWQQFRDAAAAAVAAYRAQDGDLRNRMADVADNLDYYAGKTTGGTYAGGLADAAGQIREALGGRSAQAGGADGEQSTDLTPGVVWTDAQMEVVRHLVARIHKAEEAVRRVEALASDFDANGNGAALGDLSADAWHKAANLLRAALAPQADR